MQYAGFEAHTVKHEPLRCIYLSRLLNWVYNFAVRSLEDANRLIADSKSRLRTRLLSIIHETQGIETLIRHSCTCKNFVLYRRQHRKRPLTAAVSNRHTEIDILGPKVVENCRYTGRSGPRSWPRPWRFSLASLMDDPALPIRVQKRPRFKSVLMFHTYSQKIVIWVLSGDFLCLAEHRHNVKVLLSNNTVLYFAGFIFDAL